MKQRVRITLPAMRRSSNTENFQNSKIWRHKNQTRRRSPEFKNLQNYINLETLYHRTFVRSGLPWYEPRNYKIQSVQTSSHKIFSATVPKINKNIKNLLNASSPDKKISITSQTLSIEIQTYEMTRRTHEF